MDYDFLDKIIEHKNADSFSGDVSDKKDPEHLRKHPERFQARANPLLK